MNSDRDLNIEKGNYNEEIKGDYLEAKVPGNSGTNTIIQKAENVYIVEKEKPDTSSSKVPKSSSETKPKQNKFTSSFYIERPPVEQNCYQAIMEPGALLRIKAPAKMGKTLLLEKILEYGNQQNYKTVKFDFQLADPSVLTDLKTFLQWFCVSIADSLDLDDNLDKYWRDIYGLNKNCTRYFQKYLLSVIDTPLVLALDNFERLFAEKEIFGEFCLLLRGWYETAKQGARIGQLWKKLRLIVVYSTDDYPKLNTNHSPFNVGLLFELSNFTQEQVKQLVQLYKLEKQIDLQGINSLMALVEGNPALITRALLCLQNQYLSLGQLLQTAPTEEGIYSNSLHQLLWNLQQNPLLKAAFEQVVTYSSPVLLNSEIGFKLKSMGLVKLSGDGYLPSCDLYRQYFSVHLKDT